MLLGTARRRFNVCWHSVDLEQAPQRFAPSRLVKTADLSAWALPTGNVPIIVCMEILAEGTCL